MAQEGFREYMHPDAAPLAKFHRLLSSWKSFAEKSQTAGHLTDSTICDLFLWDLLNQHPSTTLRGTAPLNVTSFNLMRLRT